MKQSFRILALILLLVGPVMAGQSGRNTRTPRQPQPDDWEYPEWLDTLESARVTAIKEKMRNTTQTGLLRLDSKKLTAGYAVFGSPDIIKTLQLMPGVAAGNELMSGLYVHGGDGNDNLFLLDGVPLYNVSHFGGLFSSFNTDVVDNLDFYKSGFPARYGSRMSSVVDVETRPGDMQDYHGSFSLGLIDGRIQVEGPIWRDKTSFNLGVRRTWMDVITIPAIAYANRKNTDGETVSGNYAMSDMNARITHRFSPTSILNVNFYTGLDHLRSGLQQTVRSLDDFGNIHTGQDDMHLGVKWGSLTASVSHQYEYSRKLRSKALLYYSRSNSDTGYTFDLWSYGAGTDNHTTMDDTNLSYVKDLGFKYDFDWFPNNSHHVRFGTALQHHWYHSSRDYVSASLAGGVETSSNSDSELQDYRSFEPSLYIEDEIFLLYNLTVNAGLRFGMFTTSTPQTWPTIEPRVSMKWLLSPNISAKLSYTRMSQYAHLVAATYMDLPSNSWMPSTGTAGPMISDQVAGGIYTNLWPDFTFNLEGWYKTMDHLLAYNGSNSFVPPLTEWEKSFTDGSGKSYGMEVEATYDNGWLGLSAYYTLSWTLRNFDAFYYGWYLDRNDNRHKLNLVGSWHFLKYFDFFANWSWHTGNRITFPSHIVKENSDPDGIYVYDAPYNAKLPNYHRLDVGLSYTRQTRRENEWKVNLSVYNVYNHRNAVLAFLETGEDGNFHGMAYGLVPIIPTLTISFKF
ncbi:MAG: TonB-dependent receptor plug domain-containing protein [Bacteroidales bacterium]|nr:TonB-dependent receptor plug domain-containing protein [Bacteroidales bacterium]